MDFFLFVSLRFAMVMFASELSLNETHFVWIHETITSIANATVQLILVKVYFYGVFQ